ncbi:2-aminoadipate transaminase [mine drainage metagenome]|jgi:DNA-binding transcriptional MocR family regulator|uniref:2-aminoadipate transaminase n=1 Tax=mine drainage metagenome TaxID=410659 RepID=A0A1J5RPL9_9ZZZZ
MQATVQPTRKVDVVIDAVRARIASRQLGQGARLPSIRACASSMGVSKSTVVDAYERLAADGVIRARRGSGFFVAAHAPPLDLTGIAPPRERAVDPLWVSRQALDGAGEAGRPGCGWLPADWLPQAALRRALRERARATDAELADYAPPQGSPALRALLARRLRERGIDAPAAQIVLGQGVTQIVDLLCRMLLEPGDAVLVDDPCYFNFLALLRAHRVRVVGVPRGAAGPDLDAFDAALREHRPRLYLTQSALHNPTGTSLSPPLAHRLLQRAEQAQLTIIEDDVYADLDASAGVRLAAFDGLQRVVYVGGFSKTLSAAARCGFVALRGDWVEPLLDLKVATSFSDDRNAAALVHGVLADGGWRRHLEQLRTRLADASAQVLQRLQRLGIQPAPAPAGGLFAWCELPAGVDSAELARRALARGVLLAPGNVFSIGQRCAGYMRVNVAQCLAPTVCERLARALDDCVRN